MDDHDRIAHLEAKLARLENHVMRDSRSIWFTVAYRQLHSIVEAVQTIVGGIDQRVLGRALVGAPWPI